MLNAANLRKSLLVLALSASCGLLVVDTAQAADYPFPVIGNSYYINDFNAPRFNGRHNATDIIANKHQQIVSRTDGVITYVADPEPTWGRMVIVQADNGNTYNYIHMNNDTPGTDDGKASPFYAYGPDIQRGNRVVKGQLLGYIGDSGNAEETVSHLHFEVTKANGKHTNPYGGLRNNSYKISQPNQDYPLVGNEIIPSSTSFMGGYSLAFGDLDGDDVDEMIVGPGAGGKQVKVLKKDGTFISLFEPNGSSFLGGVDVAVGDVNGDGVDEIITGAGPGGRYVKVFKPNGTLLSKFAPYKSKIGVSVATGNFDGGTGLEIVTGARKGGGPRVNTYKINGDLLSSYYAYSEGFKGGIRVNTANLDKSNNNDEIITISQDGGTPHAKITSSTGRTVGWTKYFGEPWWSGHYDLAVSSSGDVFTSMGINRRSTIRPVSLNF